MPVAESKVIELLRRALELPPEARSAFLRDHCEDPTIRRRVTTLAGAGPGSSSAAWVRAPLGEDAIPERLDDFRILHEIGRGGMGIVYLAEDVTLHRHVALKVLPPAYLDSARAVARFHVEARAVARLSHPAIVPLHRFGEQDGIHYIACEFIDGPTLYDQLVTTRRERASELYRRRADPAAPADPFDPADHDEPPAERHPVDLPPDAVAAAAATVATIAEALHYAHGEGIVHRDVKPGNILIDRAGGPHLADFGLARDVEQETVTETGVLAGSYHYMSPEQALAHRVAVDHRTDIFSLGVVLYELLTLRRPFEGRTSREVLHALTFRDPSRLRALSPRVPRDLEVVCMKALEKNPDDRYATAGEFAADLRCVLADQPITARPPSLARRTRRAISRHRLLAAAAAGVLVTTAVSFGVVSRVRGADRAVVTVTADHAEADVWITAIDPMTRRPRPPQRLGAAPVAEAAVEPGLYRVVTSVAGVGFSEQTRYLADRAAVALRARIRPTDDVVADMIRIDGGPLQFGQRPPNYEPHALREAACDAFYIDRTEVCNRDYRAFLDDTGHSPPLFWGGVYDPAWDDLPVVGVTHDDARAYAEWAGKRLPTELEWERAARGTDGRSWPWGATPVPAPGLANVGGRNDVSKHETMDEPRFRVAYVDGAWPVDSLPPGCRDVSPVGMLHALGNVSEWTESPNFTWEHGGPVLMPYQMIIKGDHWGFDAPTCELEAFRNMWHARHTNWLGFRCAKSAAP